MFPCSTEIEVRPVQPEKALASIDVTLLGMVIEVRPVQPEKANLSMDITLLGITVFLQPHIRVFVVDTIIALHPSRESKYVFPCSTEIEVRPIQPWKGRLPIDVTLLGMVIEVRPEHPSKALSPMDVTLLGMVIEVRQEQ